MFLAYENSHDREVGVFVVKLSFIFSDYFRIVFILCACVGELTLLTDCVLVYLCWYVLAFAPARTVHPHLSCSYNLAWLEANQNKWLLTLHSGTGLCQYLWESFPFGLQEIAFSFNELSITVLNLLYSFIYRLANK